MNENNITTNILNQFQQFICTLFANVKDLNGNAIDATAHIHQLLPAFFNKQILSYLGVESIDLMSDRLIGTAAFYQSLIKYIHSKYSNLNSILFERVYLKALSKLPLSILSTQLNLNDRLFDSNYESSERFIFITGVLSFHHGLATVDSFLHPLFAKYVFKEPSSQQKSVPEVYSSFPQMIVNKGGSFTVSYEKLLVKSTHNGQNISCSENKIENEIDNSNNGTRWLCLINYRLVNDGPWLQHARQGRSKKIARIRATYDIYNYYKRNDKQLVTHCTNQRYSNNNNDQQQQQLAESIYIPTELLYQYDDDAFTPALMEPITTTPLATSESELNIKDEPMSDNNDSPSILHSSSTLPPQGKPLTGGTLGKRARKSGGILYISAQPTDYDNQEEEKNVDEFLVHALLSDFSAMSCDEASTTSSVVSFKPLDRHMNFNNNNNNNNNQFIPSASSSSSSNTSISGSPIPHTTRTNDKTMSDDSNDILLSSSTSAFTSSIYEPSISPLKYTLNQTGFFIKNDPMSININEDVNEDKHDYKKYCFLPPTPTIASTKLDQQSPVISPLTSTLSHPTMMTMNPPPLSFLQHYTQLQHQQHCENYESKENLTKQVRLCLQHLNNKDKKQLQNHYNFLKKHPHDSKGYLINLARKLNSGYCDSKVDTSTCSKIPSFIAKATFGAAASINGGDDDFEIRVVYTASKKTAAEGMAAFTIISLLYQQLDGMA
ncbi:hypothetical protein BJ944DRAFT_264836 [Cunninghamella echinulata]|nr:hypothetical protein BJ944DRAFT_264836 [Cunninghamella echinulata]